MYQGRQCKRRVILAWMLMVVFMLPLAVRSLHVCHVEDVEVCSTTSQTTVHQTLAHDPGCCPICHFTFFSFDKAEMMVLATVFAIVVAVKIVFQLARYRQTRADISSLRAPPYYIVG